MPKTQAAPCRCDLKTISESRKGAVGGGVASCVLSKTMLHRLSELFLLASKNMCSKLSRRALGNHNIHIVGKECFGAGSSITSWFTLLVLVSVAADLGKSLSSSVLHFIHLKLEGGGRIFHHSFVSIWFSCILTHLCLRTCLSLSFLFFFPSVLKSPTGCLGTALP